MCPNALRVCYEKVVANYGNYLICRKVVTLGVGGAIDFVADAGGKMVIRDSPVLVAWQQMVVCGRIFVMGCDGGRRIATRLCYGGVIGGSSTSGISWWLSCFLEE